MIQLAISKASKLMNLLAFLSHCMCSIAEHLREKKFLYQIIHFLAKPIRSVGRNEDYIVRESNKKSSDNWVENTSFTFQVCQDSADWFWVSEPRIRASTTTESLVVIFLH